MKTHFTKITENLYGFLLWDDSWNSYNNCYLLIDDNKIILIDSGKEEHFDYLNEALKSINIEPKDVTHFIATHGHKDHIGGVEHLVHAEKLIHSSDVEILPNSLRNQVQPTLPNHGKAIEGLECVHLGHHTKGSVALYHSESKALFCGDHICFFGEQLHNNQVVEEGKSVRDQFKKFVSDWSRNEEMREKYNFELFMEGLNSLKDYEAEYLCTGHGVVLKEDIKEFISDLISYK